MTTIVLPPWFWFLIIDAFAVGCFLGVIHMVAWPGQMRREKLPEWMTQIIGTTSIWVGVYVFCVFGLHDSTFAWVLAVFIAFAGAVPLGLRALRRIAKAFDFENSHTRKES